MIWPGMCLPKGLKLSALLALAVPALVALTAITTLADSSPSPSGSPTQAPLPGDPTKGAILYGQNCAGCHGSNLGGGVGPALNPIYHLPGVADPLDATWLIDIITKFDVLMLRALASGGSCIGIYILGRHQVLDLHSPRLDLRLKLQILLHTSKNFAAMMID